MCFSQAQRQVYRVTERSFCKLRKDRANSCPDIVQQLNRDFDHFSNSNWRYTTANEPVYPDPYLFKNDQQTQTEIIHTLQVKDTGTQYIHLLTVMIVVVLTWSQILKGQKT